MQLLGSCLAFHRRGRAACPTDFHMEWLRLIRFLTQYVAPGLAAVVVVVEIIGWLLGALVLPSVTHTYHSLLLAVFSLLSTFMIDICCWIVLLWAAVCLFFKIVSYFGSQIT